VVGLAAGDTALGEELEHEREHGEHRPAARGTGSDDYDLGRPLSE